MPSGRSASITAFATAGSAPVVPASPAPFTPSRLFGDGTQCSASFALFSTVKTFKDGQPIIVEGEEADGFYILLSGHLAVGTGGHFISALSEGDVFGELDLLEGGTREASVTVVSADAEVLFMSTRSFQHLLHTVQAFAWGIWETAAGRRDRTRRP